MKATSRGRRLAVLAAALTAPVAIGLGGVANAQAATGSAATAPTVSAASTASGAADALKRQLGGSRGVEFAETITDTVVSGSQRGRRTVSRTEGVAQFGDGRVVATDSTDGTTRWISFADRAYGTGALFPTLPAGKDWVVSEDAARPDLTSGSLALDDPAVIKALLATAASKRSGGTHDGIRTTLYQGKITFAGLRKAFPGLRLASGAPLDAARLKAKLSWRLWLGQDQLVRRAWSSWTEPRYKGVTGDVVHVSDTRLTDWGTQARIVSPPEEKVTTPGDVALNYAVNGSTGD
ncbi:hypothetical protein ACWDTT_01535 [Streptosporangium sandarakinum]|uniref:Lipoprotein n=1 Tax=Streptosporangium sandarakinum TaxID=1260955 RepID=A0A852V4C3_9ACTN|nr:hypothetical protein [Streptosporangium sandarakinum]NYF42448.1 hypothetical protein [Streptosporangium sandarakinum]